MTRIIRGEVVSFGVMAQDCLHERKGAVVIGDEGRIAWCGALDALPEAYRKSSIDDFSDCLIMPGFIDPHIHFPQYRMLAAPGKDLLDWLTRFTFPEEARYGDTTYAAAAAENPDLLAEIIEDERNTHNRAEVIQMARGALNLLVRQGETEA